MNYIFILLFTITNMSAKAPEFIAHSHSYSDIDKLVQSKAKSTLTYKQIMQQFAEGYLMLQEGVVNQDKLPIKIVTGKSAEMQLIVNKIIKKHKLKSSPRTYYNLGCLIINN